MAELSDRDIDLALERGGASFATEPRANAARFDRDTGRMVVDLTNGCTFVFPVRFAEGLERATDDEIAAVEILGSGTGLHWETLDVDLSVAGLLEGRFGRRAHMDGLKARSGAARHSRSA